uniref:Uncharacterized protein n=1 Tax=Rhizophora mucronata TaxID=61149 RepID=A0A2P2NFZ4_RHIMU
MFFRAILSCVCTYHVEIKDYLSECFCVYLIFQKFVALLIMMWKL